MKVTAEIEHELLAIKVKWPSSFPSPGTDNIAQQLVDDIHMPTYVDGDNSNNDETMEPSTESEEELMETDNSEDEVGLDNTDALNNLLQMLAGDSQVDTAISNFKDNINGLGNVLKQGNVNPII